MQLVAPMKLTDDPDLDPARLQHAEIWRRKLMSAVLTLPVPRRSPVSVRQMPLIEDDDRGDLDEAPPSGEARVP